VPAEDVSGNGVTVPIDGSGTASDSAGSWRPGERCGSLR